VAAGCRLLWSLSVLLRGVFFSSEWKGKQQSTKQYRNLRVDFDIELLTLLVRPRTSTLKFHFRAVAFPSYPSTALVCISHILEKIIIYYVYKVFTIHIIQFLMLRAFFAHAAPLALYPSNLKLSRESTLDSLRWAPSTLGAIFRPIVGNVTRKRRSAAWRRRRGFTVFSESSTPEGAWRPPLFVPSHPTAMGGPKEHEQCRWCWPTCVFWYSWRPWVDIIGNAAWGGSYASASLAW
jgi:hypothetical protein